MPAAENSDLSKITYDTLVSIFRLNPGKIAEVAKLAGVDKNTARKAWDGLYHAPERPWAIPIKAIIEMDMREGLATASTKPEFKEQIPKKRGPGRPRNVEYLSGELPPPVIPAMTVRKLALLAEAEAISKAEKREEIRQAHIQQIAREKRLIIAAQEELSDVFETIKTINPTFRALALSIAADISKDPLLSTREKMEMMGKWVNMVEKMIRATDVTVGLLRLDRGASTQNVEVHHHAGDEMSYEEAMETMSEAVEEAKQLGVTSDETIDPEPTT